MKEARAVTPSTQFFPVRSSDFAMASLLVVRARIVRRYHRQDEPEATKDALQNILFATESFAGRRTSTGRAR